MIRYGLAALALKTFSLNRFTKKTYRMIANARSQKSRETRSIDNYIGRCDLFLSLCKKYDAVPANAMAFELGTGWLHFYSIYLRLFYDVRVTMLDVWDNRQFVALTGSFRRLRNALPAEVANDPHVARALASVIDAKTYDELYRSLGLNYIIEPTGIPHQCPTGSFDLIFSFHVLEHVPAERVDELLGHFFRMLKPGGTMIHQIGIDDHLAHYDARESPKNYLRYSDRTWKLLFENEIQYFNRLQRSEWLQMLAARGFVFQEEIAERANIDKLRISPRFAAYTREDLACTILTIVHTKPV